MLYLLARMLHPFYHKFVNQIDVNRAPLNTYQDQGINKLLYNVPVNCAKLSDLVVQYYV